MEDQSLYLSQLLPKNQFQSMTKYAEKHGVPIMDRVSMHYINNLMLSIQPKKILEVGTAIGYSAINMALHCHATIYTIERNEVMLEQAKKNIREFDLDRRITMIEGDAIEQLSYWPYDVDFDVIFIDAAKGQYQTFFNLSEKLLKDNGTIICDNVLFRGYVAKPDLAESKRLAKLSRKIADFNHWLMSKEQYHTSIIPIGDGMSMSTKKNTL